MLAEAAAAAAGAGQDGQVTQYLAGVPDLLDRYAGPGGDPYGQAVITAAMDAARLGHASPLPAALLQEAAVGYLTGPQRTKAIASWRDTALAWATEELKGAVRALQPVPPPSGTGVAGYQVADYLDQHGRRTRQDQLGPASLWDALTTHAASARDLTRLGQAARDRGLYRHAAALWTTAATLGSADAARQLITHLRQVSPGDTTRAAHWAAGQVSLDDPWAVAVLLGALHAGRGAGDAVAALLARDPAGQVSLDDPGAVAGLLRALREAGAGDAVAALLARDPAAQASLDDPRAVAGLLRELREAGAGDAVTALADPGRRPGQPRRPGGRRRAAGGAARGRGRRRGHRPAGPRPRRPGQPRRPGGRRRLLRALREAGAGDAVTALAAGPPPGQPRRPGAVAGLLRGPGPATRSAPWPTGRRQASLDDPGAVAGLLRALREAGAGDAVTALLARDPAGQASLDDPGAVAELLRALRAAGAGDAVAALLARDPAGQASLDDPGAVAGLLRGAARGRGRRRGHRALAAPGRRPRQPRRPGSRRRAAAGLRAAGAGDAVTTLLARDPAGQASLDDPGAVAALLRALRAAGAGDAVRALLARDPAATPASTTRGPSPSCWRRWARPGPTTRHRPGRPGRQRGHVRSFPRGLP